MGGGGVLCPYLDSQNTQRVTEPLTLWPPKVRSLSKGQSWGWLLFSWEASGWKPHMQMSQQHCPSEPWSPKVPMGRALGSHG